MFFGVFCQQTDESIVLIASGRRDLVVRERGTIRSTFVLNSKKMKIIA